MRQANLLLMTLTLATCGLTVLSSCARNTLAQDLAWQRWEQCRTSGVKLKEITTEGAIWVWYRPGFTNQDLGEFRACEQRTMAQQARPGASTSTSALVAPAEPLSAVSVPRWKRGYEWAYRWESPAGSGTYVWSVDREEGCDGVECFVMKTGSREIFYRKSDLASVKETVDGVVISRKSPPSVHYSWPMEAGKTWEDSYTDERARDRQTVQVVRTVQIEKTETITVPAGTFEAFKITVRNKRTGALVYEMWYAPAVMQWVKIRENLASGLRQREMIAYKLTQ